MSVDALSRASSQMLADLPPPRLRISCIKPHLSRWQSLSGNTPKPAMSFAYDLDLFFTPAGTYVTDSLREREGGRHLPRVVDALHGAGPEAVHRWGKRRRNAAHSASAMGLTSGHRRNTQGAPVSKAASWRAADARADGGRGARGGDAEDASAAAEAQTLEERGRQKRPKERVVIDDELLSTTDDEDDEEEEDEEEEEEEEEDGEADGEVGRNKGEEEEDTEDDTDDEEDEGARDRDRGEDAMAAEAAAVAAEAGGIGKDSGPVAAASRSPVEEEAGGAPLPSFVALGGTGQAPTGKFEVDVPWLDPASHAMLAASEVRWYPPGHVLYAEGEVAGSALLVLEGSAAVYYSVSREGGPVGQVVPEVAAEAEAGISRRVSDSTIAGGASRSESQRFSRVSRRGLLRGEATRPSVGGGASGAGGAGGGGGGEGEGGVPASFHPCNPYAGEVVHLATLSCGNWVGEATLLDATAPAYWPFTVVTLETAAVMSVDRERLGEKLATEVPPASGPLPGRDELPRCLRGAATATRVAAATPHGEPSPGNDSASAPGQGRRGPSTESRLRACLSLAPRTLVGQGWAAVAGPSLLSMGEAGSAALIVAPSTPPLLAGESSEARAGGGRPSLAGHGPRPRSGTAPSLPYAVHRASSVLPAPEARATDALRLLCDVGPLHRLLRTQNYCVYPLHDPANPGVMDFTAPPSPEALVCSLSECLRFPAGSQVCVAGEPADAVFVVLRGCLVTSFVDAATGKRRRFALRRGDYLGDYALMGNTTWRTSVKAVEPTVLIVLAADRVRQVLAVFPELWEPACSEAQQAAEQWQRSMEARLLDITAATDTSAS